MRHIGDFDEKNQSRFFFRCPYVFLTASVSGAYTKIDGRSSSYPVTAYLANVKLDATAQSGDQYATVGLYNSNVTPSGTGVTTSSFTLSGSVPSCSF